MKRHLLFLSAASLVVLGFARLVAAHAVLEKAAPEPGAVIEDELEEVRLEFSEGVKDPQITLLPQCEDCGDELYELAIEQPEANVVIGKIDAGMVKADYNVLWSVNSLDDHPISGTYSFTYEGPDTTLNRYWVIIPFIVIVAMVSFGLMLYVLKQYRPQSARR